MTAAVAAAVDLMWRGVLREYGLPAEGAAVAEADCMWKEILKEKGLPLDTLYRRPIVPLRLKSIIEEKEWVYQQRKILGDVGYQDMIEKKAECFQKRTMAKYEMINMLEKEAKKKKMLKKAAKKKKKVEDQEALALLNDKKKKNK